jgi:hypothetical protein
MSTKLSGLLAGIKKSVVDAHRSVCSQHMEELEKFFQPAPGQSADLEFPNGEWNARTVAMNIPKEVSHNGVVTLENHKVMVPLITLLPLKSLTLERIEVLTTIDLSLANLSEEMLKEKSELPSDVQVSFGSAGPNATEIKMIIQASNLPDGYARLVGAYEKLLNAQLPN